MTSAPPPPPGWELEPLIPTSQQQAQDTVIGYLTRTVEALPAGTRLDATRYRVGNGNRSCDDLPTGSDKPEMMFTDVRQVLLPEGADAAGVISEVGDIWRSWGWHVFERDDFPRPNQFGYGPDGYRLQIESSTPPGHPPTISGISPCFPGSVASDDVAVPTVIPST
ncbi:hypothetical protein [Mycolicibacterium duvalii]|uniref:Lipoprotein LppJ n=1 Tax=Mycolicibacterium duvalii TaxID=39688 RepID=A0A7I7K520_9MYCO|nr:hypothetical protein [Mycolicibacterium duvalii]BBX18704.1 hypothetical protein MDUV_35640 [Mycolicibacterium duvalii]